MKRKFNLGLAIVISMFLGVGFGYLGIQGIISPEFITTYISPMGTTFIKLIRMLVVPLVFVSIILGASSLGETKSAGKVGILTFAYYMVTSAFAVVIGLAFGELFQPGKGIEIPSHWLVGDFTPDQSNIPGFWETINGIIPSNIADSLLQGNMLQIIFFALFLGIAISSLKKDDSKGLLSGLKSLNTAFIWMVIKIMYIAPFGVFALMADSIVTFGFDILALLIKLFVIYIVALLLQTFGIYGLLVHFLSNISVKEFFGKISKAQVVALSTSSSAATLPVTTECVQEMGVDEAKSSFILPLGATVNMDGNAIYYALATVFFAQIFGIDLGVTQYIAIIITATVGSIGQAGVPGPSLLVVAVLMAANVPVVGLPILFGVDRLFDMLRTAVNITGDASCAVIVNKQVRKKI